MAPDGQEPAAGCCREAVAALLKSPQVEVRWRAVFALNQMAEEISPEHVPAIAELLGDEDASVRERAGDALARMGGAGAEALVKKVEDAGPDVEQEAALAALALVGQPGVRPAASRLDHGSAGVRRRAAATLQQLAAWAKEHAKDLARLLGDREEDVRLAAVQALVALGGDGAGALASAVASPKDVVKLHALQGLGLLGPAAGPHAVAVARLMDYPHEKVSAAANSTIEGLGAPGAAALCAHLRSDQADARANAVQALSKLADAGVDMLPFADALVAGLADPDGALRARAATALGRAGPLAAPLAAEPLAALLGDGAALAQGRGEEALSKMGVGGVAVLLGPLGLAHELPAVRAAALRCLRQTSLEVLEQVGLEEIVRVVGLHLADGDGQVRLASVRALGALPPPVAAASLAGLACCAADGSDPVRAAALLVLGALGPEHEGGEVVLAELARRMGDDAAEVRAAAAKAMGCFGEAAEKHVRLLVRVLKEDSFPPARASAAEALGLVGPAAGGFMQALVKALSDPERDVRRSTVDACGRLSVTTPQSSVQAAPGLAKVVLSPGEDGQLRAAAMAALRSMGKAGCACLMSSLSDVNPQVQLQAIDAFEQLDAEERQPHVQALGRLLQDEHPGTRARAAAAAGRLGQAGLHLAAALAQRLQDGDPGVREAVALALHGLGHEAVSKHAQHIARNLPNPHSGVRAAAARALGAAGAAGRAHAPTICQMLLDEEQAVRQSAWRALAELGEHAAHVVPSLAALLDGTHEDETTAVAVVVAQQGGEGVEAVCRYLEDARPAMRAACCAALGAVGGAGAPAAVRVAQLLEDIDPRVRATAREALLRMGAEGAAALAGALPRAGAGLRQGAVAAVGRLGAAGAAEAPAVAARLVDPLRSVRAAAARALVQMGAPAAPVLAEALGSASAHVRRCAAEGLGCLGPAASGAAERLAAQVTDEDPVVQEVAILASGRVGEAATSALARQLGAADQRLQRRSAEALGRLGALASAQAPALAARLDPLLEDASPAVREVCVWALGRVGPAGPQALADLLGVAHHGSTKKSVCGCLGRLGGAAARHSVAVAAELGGEDRAVAASAADALVRFGKEGAAALAGRLEDADPVVREIAAEAMGRTLQPMEAEHAQQLAARLSDSEILVRRAAATSLGRVPAEVGRPFAADLAALLGDDDAWVRARAAESLGRLGQAAEAHAPQLAALLEGREGWGEGQYAPRASSQAWGWQFAAEALRRCGRAEPKHAALLAAHLADPDAPVRVAAAAALGKLGCTAAAAQLQDLAGLLQDPDERVRRATSQALGEAGGGSAPAAAALASTLAEDACAVVRAAAATALGAFGESAAEHADAVAKALEDPDGAVRQAAAAALPLLGAEGLAKSPLLAQLLGDERASVREAAYAELVRCGAAGGAVTLASVARDSSRPVAVRRVAAQGLAELGAAAAEQADALAGLLLVPDSALRESAVRGLAKMGPRGVTELERLLQHSSEQGRCAACQVLGSMGPAAGASAGALALRLDDHSPLVRRTAATALGRLGDAAAPQLPRLAALLEAHDALLFKSVLDVLGGLGRHAGKHAKAVAFRLDAAGDEVRQSAAHALGTLGEAAAGHAPDLARALLDREPMVRANSAWALGRCGEAGAAYVDRLAALLGDGDCRVRARACESLGRLLAGAGEGERREGAARLAGGLEDEDLAVRCAAAEAICRMGVDSMAPYAVGLVRVVENSSVGYDVTAVDARLAELLARELGVAFPHPLAFLPKAFAGDDLFPLAAEAEVPGKLGCVLSVLHAARWAPLLSSGDSWWTTRARPLQEAYIKGAKERASPAYLKQVDRVLEDFERSEKTGTPQPLTDAIEASLARSFGP